MKYMKIIVTGRNIVVTDALRSTVEKKLGKLDKYFSKDVEIKVRLGVEKVRQIIEVTIPFDGAILRAEEWSDDMYHSIDKVVDVLERQIRKHKTKLQRRNHIGETIRFENIHALPNDEKENEHKIVKTKRFAMKPMDAEEAVLQMELLGHNFFVFKDAETDEVNVVYKRKDGNYGLIEPEF
jgi:putative sigma-54 modulation protein